MNDTLKVAGRIGAELGAAKAENEAMRILLRESYSELLVMKTEVGFRGKTLDLIERIDAFLSQQTEPTDAFTAVDMATAAAQAFRDGQAAVEQAPAQDEQEIIGVERYRVEPTGRGFWPFCVRAGSGERELFIGHRKICEQVAAELATAFEDGKFVATRPAQTEQQPFGWVTEDYLTDKSATTYDQVVADRWRAKGWPVREIYAAPIAQTAPQGLRIVFDGPPGPEAGRFVEVENASGCSVNAGEWRARADGLWELVLHAAQGGE